MKKYKINFSIPKPLLDEVKAYKAYKEAGQGRQESISALVCEFLRKMVKSHKRAKNKLGGR